METSVQTAFLLLLLGMTTVFLILWSVILLSRGLIHVTNKWEKKKKTSIGQVSNLSTDDVQTDHIAIIAAAVASVTKSKGLVRSIEKVEPVLTN